LRFIAYFYRESVYHFSPKSKRILMSAPVFLLAFAYDQSQALPEVVNELKTIQKLLASTGGNAEPIWQVTLDDLEERFDTQRNDLRLFHYSGHAGPNGLSLNRGDQASRITFGNGIARQAGWVKDLRLVFLNGCSTREQAQVFLDQGAAAVIATTKPLIDKYAVDFARRFYQSFTRRNGLSTLQQAFDAAFIAFTDEYGNLTRSMLDENVRGSIELDEEANEPLYELHLHPQKKEAGNQRFSEWFEATPVVTPVTPPITTSTTNNGSASTRTKIQELVGQGRLEEALNELVKVNSDAILLKGQYAAAKRENNMGIMESGDWNRTVARLNNAVLEMVRGL